MPSTWTPKATWNPPAWQEEFEKHLGVMEYKIQKLLEKNKEEIKDLANLSLKAVAWLDELDELRYGQNEIRY